MCDCLGPLLLPPHPYPPYWVLFSHRKHGGVGDSLRMSFWSLGRGRVSTEKTGGRRQGTAQVPAADEAPQGSQGGDPQGCWQPSACHLPSSEGACAWTVTGLSPPPHTRHMLHQGTSGRDRHRRSCITGGFIRTVSLVKLGQWAALGLQICDLSERRRFFC